MVDLEVEGEGEGEDREGVEERNYFWRSEVRSSAVCCLSTQRGPAGVRCRSTATGAPVSADTGYLFLPPYPHNNSFTVKAELSTFRGTSVCPGI